MFSQQRLHHRHLLLNDFFLKRLVKFRWDNFVELMRKKSFYSLNKTFQMKMFWPRTLFFALLSKLNELAHVANETLERHVFFCCSARDRNVSPPTCVRETAPQCNFVNIVYRDVTCSFYWSEGYKQRQLTFIRPPTTDNFVHYAQKISYQAGRAELTAAMT